MQFIGITHQQQQVPVCRIVVIVLPVHYPFLRCLAGAREEEGTEAAGVCARASLGLPANAILHVI